MLLRALPTISSVHIRPFEVIDRLALPELQLSLDDVFSEYIAAMLLLAILLGHLSLRQEIIDGASYRSQPSLRHDDVDWQKSCEAMKGCMH